MLFKETSKMQVNYLKEQLATCGLLRAGVKASLVN